MIACTATNARDVGTFIGGFIKYQLKSTSETDQAKYYYLLMLKIFVDTGNKELVVDFLPKNLMKRLGMIALHRKQEKEMDRGSDCIRHYSAMNDPSVGRNSATGFCMTAS